jgi:serine protease inhibitor
MYIKVSILMLALSLAGCGGADSASSLPDKTPSPVIPTPQNVPETTVFTQLKAVTRSASLASELEIAQQVLAINNYALRSLNISNSVDNLVLVPYSEQSLFSQLYFASSNEAAQQIAEKFNFAVKHPAFFSTFNSLDLLLTTEQNTLQSSRVLWAEQSYDFSLDFLTNSKANMGSQVRDLDISTQTAAANADFNSWLAMNSTNENFDLEWLYTLQENDKLIALNKLDFQVNWLNSVDPALNYTATFTQQNDTSIDVEYISTTLTTTYFDDGDKVMVAIPTEDPHYNLYLLSSKQESFESMVEELSTTNIEQLIGAMSLSDITINFPKFTSASKASLVGELGLISDQYNAQLPLLNATQQNDVYLVDAQQKIQLQADETGIKFGALTGFILREKPESSSHTIGVIVTMVNFPIFVIKPIEETIVARFDKPFVYFIQDKLTGTLITLGRINNPANN